MHEFVFSYKTTCKLFVQHFNLFHLATYIKARIDGARDNKSLQCQKCMKKNDVLKW